MDCFDMKYTPSSFDCVIDKSTLDTFLCSEELFNHIPDYLEGILQVLKQNGYLLLISINPPEAVILDYYLLWIDRSCLYFMSRFFIWNGNETLYIFHFQLIIGEEMNGLEVLKEKYDDLTEEDLHGMYSYLYILKKI